MFHLLPEMLSFSKSNHLYKLCTCMPFYCYILVILIKQTQLKYCMLFYFRLETIALYTPLGCFFFYKLNYFTVFSLVRILFMFICFVFTVYMSQSKKPENVEKAPPVICTFLGPIFFTHISSPVFAWISTVWEACSHVPPCPCNAATQFP